MSQLPRILEPEAMETHDEAIAYDAMDHTEPNNAFVDRLVELNATGHMLDIGTGPGHIPLLVAERISTARIHAIDLSPIMLELAEQRRAASDFADRVTLQKVDAKSLPFDDASFDTVFSNTILHHIPDPIPFLTEAFRVLKPGGAFLIRDLYRPPTRERHEELVALHGGNTDDRQTQLFADSLHAALTPGELQDAAQAAGLPSDVIVVIDTDRHMSLQKSAD